MSFSNIVGQKRATELLKSDIVSGRVAETYIFTGPEGSGKLATALEFAKALNCKKSDKDDAAPDESGFLFAAENRVADKITPVISPDACGECASCRKIEAGTYPDVFVLDFDSQADILDLDDDEKNRQRDLRIDAVRVMVNNAYITPLEGKKKVFIIDGAELLSDSSANALLKVLEESPKYAHWILLALSPERIIRTVLSRARRVSFAPLSLQDKKALEASGKTFEASRKTSGKDAKEAGQLEEIAEKIFFPAGGEIPDPLEISSKIFLEGKKGNTRKYVEKFLKIAASRMRDRLHQRPGADNAEKLALVLQSQDELRRNVSPQMILDSLLLSIL